VTWREALDLLDEMALVAGAAGHGDCAGSAPTASRMIHAELDEAAELELVISPIRLISVEVP
jgi:hypothetical protein